MKSLLTYFSKTWYLFKHQCVRCHLYVVPVILPVDLTAIPFFIWRHFSVNTSCTSLVSASLPSMYSEIILLIFFLLPSCVAQGSLLSFYVLSFVVVGRQCALYLKTEEELIFAISPQNMFTVLCLMSE